MRFITVHDGQDTLARVCAVKCDVPAFPEPNSSIGIWDSEENKLVGGVTYANYTTREIWASIWLENKRALTRPILRELFSYPFITCGVVRLTTNTKASNEKSLKMQKQMGYVYEGRLRRFFGDEDGDDAIILSMLKEECRWI